MTGVSDTYMFFDWFHQENCSDETEYLHRSSSVAELAAFLNTQILEQLNRNKAKDSYFLNETCESNHMFVTSLMSHLHNVQLNDSARKCMEFTGC